MERAERNETPRTQWEQFRFVLDYSLGRGNEVEGWHENRLVRACFDQGNTIERTIHTLHEWRREQDLLTSCPSCVPGGGAELCNECFARTIGEL